MKLELNLRKTATATMSSVQPPIKCGDWQFLNMAKCKAEDIISIYFLVVWVFLEKFVGWWLTFFEGRY